jgi:hypothetical protein
MTSIMSIGTRLGDFVVWYHERVGEAYKLLIHTEGDTAKRLCSPALEGSRAMNHRQNVNRGAGCLEHKCVVVGVVVTAARKTTS